MGLMAEIQVNLAYRWFLGYDLDECSTSAKMGHLMGAGLEEISNKASQIDEARSKETKSFIH